MSKRILLFIAIAAFIAVSQLKPQTPVQTNPAENPQRGARGAGTGTATTTVAPLPVTAAPGKIHGMVVREGTADPILGAVVTVNGAANGNRGGNNRGANAGNGNRGANPAPLANNAVDPFTTTTDSSGRFSFEEVPSGNRTVTVQLEGYFAPTPNGTFATTGRTSVTVVPGQIADVKIGMIPGGTISGRVYDLNGMPVSDAQVQALRREYQDGQPGLQATNSRTTDDRGEYRVYRLPPGDYFVVATPPRSARGARGTLVSTALPVKTFYPGVSDPSLAVPMTLRGGEELSGANISIRTETAATVSGQITSSLPAPGVTTGTRGQARGATAANSTLTLTAHDKSSPNSFTNTATISLAAPTLGKFQILNVPPGVYDLFASLSDATASGVQGQQGQQGQQAQRGQQGQRGQRNQASGPLGYGRTTVEVRGSDVEGVSVNVHTGTDISGRITVDGGTEYAQNVRVALQSEDSGSRFAAYQQLSQVQTVVDENGNFKIPAVPDGRYRVQVTYANGPVDPGARGNRGGNQEGGRGGGRGGGAAGRNAAPLSAAKAYVEEIRMGAVSAYDNGMVVGGQSAGQLEVMIRTGPGTIQGTVIGNDQKPAAQTPVFLVPSANRRQNLALYKTATSDVNGKFSMSGIAPGEYQLFAWKDVVAGAFQNPDYLRKYDGRGTIISIPHAATVTAEVRVIPAENR